MAANASRTIYRIDPETNEVVAEIALDEKPDWFAVSSGFVLVTSPKPALRRFSTQPQAPRPLASRWVRCPADPGTVNGLYWVALEAAGDVVVIDTNARPNSRTIELDKPGIWVAEGLLGDGWVLDFSGTEVLRITGNSASASRPDWGYRA